jgi:hypothetical protein
MGHVLRVWDAVDGLLVGEYAGSHFVGLQALAAFDPCRGTACSAGAKVPVENAAARAPGTPTGVSRCSIRLMTGFLDAGANPLRVW